MSSELRVPPGAHPGRATVPEGEVTLANGTVLVPDPGLSESTRALILQTGGVYAGLVAYRGPHTLVVMASVEPTRRGELLHISVSKSDQNPGWALIKLIKDAFYGPHRDAMMVLPREPEYVNVHKYCFHLWEMPVAWRIR